MGLSYVDAYLGWKAHETGFEELRRKSELCRGCVAVMAEKLKLDDGQGIVSSFRKMSVAKREFGEMMGSDYALQAIAEFQQMLNQARVCSSRDAAEFLAKINKVAFSRAVTKTVKLVEGTRTIFLTKEGFSVSYGSRAKAMDGGYHLASYLAFAFGTMHDALITSLQSVAYNRRVVKDKAVFIKRVEVFAGFVKDILGTEAKTEREGDRVLARMAIPASRVYFQRTRYGFNDEAMTVDEIVVKINTSSDAELLVGGTNQRGRCFEVPDGFAMVQLKQMGVTALLWAKVEVAVQKYQAARANVRKEFEKELLTEAI